MHSRSIIHIVYMTTWFEVVLEISWSTVQVRPNGLQVYNGLSKEILFLHFIDLSPVPT